jgi:hypothetical protein
MGIDVHAHYWTDDYLDLLGTDFPYEAGELFVRAVDYISASGIPAKQAKAITGTAAAALLKIHTGARKSTTREVR